MERRPEPELMTDEQQAKAYSEADFAASNSRFVGLFKERCGGFQRGLVLDVGCGPGDIVLRFARAYPEAIVHGIDGSPAMLRYAEYALAHAPGLRSRVHFCRGVVPRAVLPAARYDAIISNSFLHHLHDPAALWQTVRRGLRPGGWVCVMDLFRPDSEAAARAIVDAYAAGEPEVLRGDYYNSLLAAFSLEEVGGQLRAAGLDTLSVDAVSDRHLLVWGRVPV